MPSEDKTARRRRAREPDEQFFHEDSGTLRIFIALVLPVTPSSNDAVNRPRSASSERSTAADTVAAVRALCAAGIELLLFAGGDGTARDIFDVVGSSFPVLGIPAGVKMHSGVFAVSPEAAGELLLQLVQGGLVGLMPREVRDIDEEAFRHDQVRSRFYGEMLVPGEGR